MKKVPIKTAAQMKRCSKCKKKNTLIDIVGKPWQINAFMIRSFVGIQCTSCNWSDKTYTFTDVEEGIGEEPTRRLNAEEKG